MEKIMTRPARICAAVALLLAGTTFAAAQNGPPTGGYPPAAWNPNFYRYHGYYNYYASPVAAYYNYPVPGYWDYYRSSFPGRGTDEESTH